MHEHLVLNFHRVRGNPDGILNDNDLAIREVGLYRSAGGRSLVELTSGGLSPDPLALRRIAEASGLQIVMGCGWYRELYYPPDMNRRTTNELADALVRDLELGVNGTDVRAGIIGEIGCLDHISGIEERVFRAAARAHLHTGATISTHAAWYPVGTHQLDILLEEGVDPSRVIIGHCDFYPDPAYHAAIAARGAWVQFDRVGGRVAFEWERRVKWICNLVQQGYLNQLLLSHDVCLQSDLHAYGGTGYDFVLTRLVPMLLDAGLSQAQIDRILIDNPRRALTGLA
jgi:predicted metal-dependent phosphotriesterase family hydrolase